MRIVSLLPSATEIICALGLKDSLVGISHECDYPPDIRHLPAVTASAIDKNLASIAIDQQVREHLQTSNALYMLDLELLESLQPDLIVTQALCDVCAVSAVDVEQAICRLPGNPRLVNLEPQSLDDVFSTIEKVGQASGQPDATQSLLQSMRARIAAVSDLPRPDGSASRVACLEWIDPPFNAGHWTPELVGLAGGISVTGIPQQPSQTIDWETLILANPDIVFVACCGYSLDRTLEDIPLLLAETQRLAPGFWADRQLFVTDGNHYFNRPGPRLVDSLEILATALHPDADLLGAGVPAPVQVAVER